MKVPTLDWLAKRRETIIADLKMKLEAEDLHGVQDCASDVREIDAVLAYIRALAQRDSV